MLASRNVFYAWQSDADERFNRNFIEDCLKRAIRHLNREDLSDLVIDRDTRNVPGMPDIGPTILGKIAASAVVVADLSIINPSGIRRVAERAVSNPNVLFELGYAFGTLGPKAVIGVFNSTSGAIEELPFDLRPKRLMVYSLSEGDNKAAVRAKLVELLTEALRQCLGETEDERTRRTSRIHAILRDLWVTGTEIDEWSGISKLPELLQVRRDELRELPELMRQNGYADEMIGFASYMARALEEATKLRLNDENWPAIRDRVTSAMGDVTFIVRFHPFTIDAAFHDQLVQRLSEIALDLDRRIPDLADGVLKLDELQKLAFELRRSAFMDLVPEHPRFREGLNELSWEFRTHTLRWHKQPPKPIDAVRVVQDVRLRLVQLLSKYGSD